MAKYEEWKKTMKQVKVDKKAPPKDKVQKNAAAKGQKRKADEPPAETASKVAKVDEDGFKVPQPVAPKPKEAPKPYKKGENDDRTVFVSNLDYSATAKDVMEFAGELNVAIESVDLVKDKADKSRGFGYVVMSSKETAELLIKKDRQMLKGRPVFLSDYQTGDKRKPVFR